jgi:rhodanese-related sulfurtransferase
MKYSFLFIIMWCAIFLGSASNTHAADDSLEEDDVSVAISADLTGVTIKHKGKDFRIMRNQDTEAVINPQFAKTSRACPPFCIQPISLAPGVQTLGEIEVLDYLSKIHAGDNSILVVDSRTPDWSAKGTIPGAKNIPWNGLNPKLGATTEGIMKIMSEQFGVKLATDVDAFSVDEAIVDGDTSEVFDFSNAKTLVLFCNGMWCGQSPNNIKNLLKFGYPAEKLKWYRGGMQAWSILGLSTAKP